MYEENSGNGGEEKQMARMRPWIDIWFKPREVIRAVANSTSTSTALLMAASGGAVSYIFSLAVNPFAMLFVTPFWFAASLVFAGLIGIFQLYAVSFLVFTTGTWLGGSASFREIRSVFAWRSAAVALLLLVGAGGAIAALLSGTFFGVVLLYTILASFWILIIGIRMLSEVQGFSVWKAVVNMVLGPAIIMGVLAAFLLLAGMLIGRLVA